MSYSDLTESQRLWVDALRSGNFAQCKEYLHEEVGGKHSYCCLGVACELYLRHVGDIKETESDDYDTNISRHAYEGEYEALPKKVQDWLGLDNDTGK